jgi:hypothetical protein
MAKPTKTKAAPQLTSSAWTVMSCRQPAALDDYALVLRNSDGEYCKLWDASAYKRGATVTVETIVWENGYSDSFIVG